MDLVVLAVVVTAIAAWVDLWFKARSLRVSEQQIRSQVETMQTILDKIQEERHEREAAIGQVEAQLNVIDSTVMDSHRRNWDHASAVTTLQSMQLSKLAVAMSLFAHASSLLPDLDSHTHECFDATSDLAIALSCSAEFDAKFTEEMSRWRYLHRSGKTTDTPEQVSARFDVERERISAQFTAASKRFAKAFRKETT